MLRWVKWLYDFVWMCQSVSLIVHESRCIIWARESIWCHGHDTQSLSIRPRPPPPFSYFCIALIDTSNTLLSLSFLYYIIADAKAAVTSAETELNAAKIQKVNTAKKVVAAQSNAGDYERLIKSDKSIIEQEESKIQAQKEKAAKLAQQEKAQKEKAAKRAQQEKKRLDELAKKKQEQAKKVEQEFKKKAEKQKKELERVAKEKEQRLEKQKKETAKRAKEQAQKVEKAKKEAAKIAEEKKKKEINIVQDRISQLKSAKQKMKKQGKSEKALQLMDARIAAEQDVIFKIKTK